MQKKHSLALNLLTLSEAAEALRINIRTLRYWIERGQIPALRTPTGGLRLRRADVENALTPIVPIGRNGAR